MNVFEALVFLKDAYQATPSRPALSPHTRYRQAVFTVDQALDNLRSRCRVLENSRESHILALQKQVAKSEALEAARDALATQLAAARQVGDERLRLLNEIVPRCQLLERAGRVSEEFRKDPQNHVKTWGTSYTKTVVAGLAEAWEAAPPHSSARRLIGYASDLLADYHKTSHVVYQDRDAARAAHDKAAAELSKLYKELRERVREQLLELSSRFGTPAARSIFVSAAPGKSCIFEVDGSALPALLVALARKVGATLAPTPREVHIETRVHVNLQNMPRKAVYGDLYPSNLFGMSNFRLAECFLPLGDFVTGRADVNKLRGLSFTTQSKRGATAVTEAAKARQAAKLQLFKTLARWRNPNAKPRMGSFRLIESLEEFIKALK